MIRVVSLASLLLFPFSASALPELPFPTGGCSGIIPISDPDLIEKSPDFFDGDANLTVVFDFDNAEAFGVFLLFDDWDGDNEAFAQWSADQDGSGMALNIERDDLLPASFIGSITVEFPDDAFTPDLVGVEPTGNAGFKNYELRFRLLPTAGGATYIIQTLNAPFHGFCSTI